MNPTMFYPIVLETKCFDDESSFLLQIELERYFVNIWSCFYLKLKEVVTGSTWYCPESSYPC